VRAAGSRRIEAMDNILTKEEIEALLSAVFEGRIDPERELARQEGEVAAYDLFSADSSKGYVPNLDIIYDGFIRYSRISMSNRLRKLVELKKVGARAYKFDDFLQGLPSPVCMAIFKMEPLKGAALITMDSDLVFTFVDSILGGTGKTTIPGSRMFTSIELRLVEKIVKDMLIDMEKAWAPLQATHMSLLKIEVNPRLVNIVPPEYQVATMALEIQVEESVGRITFAIPHMTIDPLRDKLKAGSQFDLMAVDPQWSNRLTRDIMETPLDLAVEMGTSVITLDELLNLAPGDTIMIDRTDPVEMIVKVGEVPKFAGIPGIRRGNKAVQIARPLKREGE
jgi:flagellar motor switch protein FliM